MYNWWLLALLWMTAAMTPAVQPNDARTFTITARRFTYSISPQPFTVNQGDVVTLQLTAADDGAGEGHGFRLRTYADSSIILTPGAEPTTVTFTAHTPGQFIFFCTRFCGSGHSGMDGVFTVLGPAPLAVDEVAPATGPTSGGTTVTIRGTGFAPGATVKFGNLPATSTQIVSATELRAVTPAGPFDFATSRVVDVVVTNPNGAAAQKNVSFTWTVPSPSITSVAPSSGSLAGGTLVTVRGAGFSTAFPVNVSFGGAPATNVTVLDAVTLTARTPAHAAGAANVDVTTNKGSASAAGAYRFLGAKRRAVRR